LAQMHKALLSSIMSSSGVWLGNPSSCTHKRAYHFGTHAQSITQQHHEQQRRLAWKPQLLHTHTHTHTLMRAYHFGTHVKSITQQHHEQQRRLAWGAQHLHTHTLTKRPTILAHMHKALLSSTTSSSGVWLGDPSS